MREQFRNYIINLYYTIPADVYEGLVSFFCVGAILLFSIFGRKQGLRYSAVLFFVEYMFMIICSTVIYRLYNGEQKYDFHPFWSYMEIYKGRVDLIPEIEMNILVFLIVGLLLSCAFRSITWWKSLLIGGSMSISIETLQYILKRGFSETDDVIHNTLGCLMGFGLYKTIAHINHRFIKRETAR